MFHLCTTLVFLLLNVPRDEKGLCMPGIWYLDEEIHKGRGMISMQDPSSLLLPLDFSGVLYKHEDPIRIGSCLDSIIGAWSV